jgi:hypothetical protein
VVGLVSADGVYSSDSFSSPHNRGSSWTSYRSTLRQISAFRRRDYAVKATCDSGGVPDVLRCAATAAAFAIRTEQYDSP